MSDISIRRSQLITPFGPGSIVEQKGQSFVVTTSDIWDSNNGIVKNEIRLQRKLRKDRFLSAPPHDEGSHSPTFARMVRFPRTHFCNKCRKLIHINFPIDDKMEHRKCTGILVPMRFVVICEKGHLGEVPWHLWAHSNQSGPQTKCVQNSTLLFKSSGSSGGLESLFIECANCGCKRSLKGILSKGALGSAHAKCCGGQPWDPTNPFDCSSPPFVVQKGSSNVSFPVLISAVDIPPYSDFKFRDNADLKLKGDEKFKQILGMVDVFDANFESLLGNAKIFKDIVKLSADYSTEIDAIKSLIREAYFLNKDGESSYSELETDHSLKEDEYKTFVRNNISSDYRDNLIMRNMRNDINIFKSGLIGNELISRILISLENVFDNVVLIEKLRVVTVFKGFYRVRTPKINIYEDNMFEDESTAEIKFTNSNRDVSRQWLPAIENYGEGIFFNINESLISSWTTEKIKERAKKIHATPKYLLLHTLSHSLIRQLSFECGYPAASIVERIYHNKEESPFKMSGILVYTYGDAQGSLGGLARQARPDRFFFINL